MSKAEDIMLAYNPAGLIGVDDDGVVVMIEDVIDPDGRVYRLEYRALPDGSKALCFCRHNPWGSGGAGESYATGHIAADGFLCLGTGIGSREVSKSPFNLADAIKRGRYWCTAFSYLKEHGTFPNP